jgi:hypothetical protein
MKKIDIKYGGIQMLDLSDILINYLTEQKHHKANILDIEFLKNQLKNCIKNMVLKQELLLKIRIEKS